MRRFRGRSVAFAAILAACAAGAAAPTAADVTPNNLAAAQSTGFVDSPARWIGGGATTAHDWRDARIDWDFTLTDGSVEFLFRARPEGKTFGETYAWKLSRGDGGARLEALSRNYDAKASPLVADSTLASIGLPTLADGRHRLTVQANGTTLVTLLDGREISRMDNADHAHGTVGIRSDQADGVLLHAVTVTPATGPATEERFVRNDNALSGGTVVAEGLTIANATNTDIVFPLSASAPLLRREFSLDQEVRSARLSIAAGGLPRIEINGRPIGEAIADGFTAYDRRVLYRTYDVTSAVQRGENVIGVELGRGWYGLAEPNEWYWHDAPWTSEPVVRAQLVLTLADGSTRTVVSDDDWRWIDGPTVHDSIYSGERYDARRLPRGWSRSGFDASAWRPARVAEGPSGRLVPAEHEPIAVVETLRPTRVTEVQPGVWVYDFGRIFSGRLRLRAEGPAGQTISLMQHEKLRPDGTVLSTSGLVDTQLQTDRYTLAGTGPEEWAPAFGWRGFRYVEVRGFPGTPTLDNLTGEVMHSDVRVIGSFESANPLLDQIQQAATRTILNNMHGFQTDTPTFEKNGWTGDAHASALASALNFDVSKVWTKWMADFRDAQSPKGEIPEIVPSTPQYGYENTPGWNMVGGPTPSWDAATFVLPDDLYQLTGDAALLADMYETQKRLVDYTATWFTPDFLYANTVNTFLGEYAIPRPPMTPEAMAALIAMFQKTGGAPPEPGPSSVDAVSTAYFQHMAALLARNAARLGKSDDAVRYGALAEAIGSAFNARYWDAASGQYRLPGEEGFPQYLNILPVAFGFAPEGQDAALMQKVADDYAAHDYHLTSTGVFSGRYVMTLLTDYGHVDTAYRIVSSTDEPSWGFWLKNDIHTMLESWDLGSRSYNHHYWGSVSSWFYQGLAGIRPGSPGYGTIVIRPAAPQGLDHVAASLDTVRGRITSSWRREGERLILDVVIPAGAEAEVWCPGAATAPEGARPLRTESGSQIFAIPGGAYRFRCS